MTAPGGPTDPIRILLADDHEVVRRGLKLVLESEPDLHVTSEAADGATALRRALRDDVDVAVLDLSMPGMSGLQATRELARLRPSIRVVILSMHNNEQYMREAMRAGASGYVLKSDGGQSLVQACRAAARGLATVDPPPRRRYAGHTLDREAEASATRLTPRETQILTLIADGHTTREIAELLVISPRTVDRHREKMAHKLNLRNRVELTRFAVRSHLIDP
jgi:DNA-binding NarL/FixJ family response regulator